MEAYLESIAARAPPRDPVFGRIVCTCEYRPSPELAELQGYWYGTHKLHADKSAAADILERFGKKNLAAVLRKGSKPTDQ